ncbi:MAG TPA: DapH/DapD/GlmU-related protein [Bauldia sp.]|nr:DapH/DapD/GlmU-related protein [Bauldia sp.]
MADTRTNYQKLLAGEVAWGPDPEMDSLQAAMRPRLKAFNETPEDDIAARQAAFSVLIGKPFEGLVRSPIMVDYGIHLTIGKTFVNSNCVFLDANTITIGDGCAIGTGVQLLAAGHPIHPSERLVAADPNDNPPFRGGVLAKPIVIGDEVWIGGGVIVLGGVTIGRGSTIGAGSVVTKSIPAFSVAAGNPARVLRTLDRRPTFFHPDPNDP